MVLTCKWKLLCELRKHEMAGDFKGSHPITDSVAARRRTCRAFGGGGRFRFSCGQCSTRDDILSSRRREVAGSFRDAMVEGADII
jgi:hypothetical protein